MLRMNQVLLFSLFALLLQDPDPTDWRPPPVASPPPASIVERFDLDDFYGKCTMVGRLPVVSSDRVDDRAHQEAAYLIASMLEHRAALIS